MKRTLSALFVVALFFQTSSVFAAQVAAKNDKVMPEGNEAFIALAQEKVAALNEALNLSEQNARKAHPIQVRATAQGYEINFYGKGGRLRATTVVSKDGKTVTITNYINKNATPRIYIPQIVKTANGLEISFYGDKGYLRQQVTINKQGQVVSVLDFAAKHVNSSNLPVITKTATGYEIILRKKNGSARMKVVVNNNGGFVGYTDYTRTAGQKTPFLPAVFKTATGFDLYVIGAEGHLRQVVSFNTEGQVLSVQSLPSGRSTK